MIGERISIRDGYELLGLEVVRQAVDDYRTALRFMTGRGMTAKCKEYIGRYNSGETMSRQVVDNYIRPWQKADKNIRECERFFRSQLMELYAPNIDGKRVIRTIRKQYSADIPNYYEEHK